MAYQAVYGLFRLGSATTDITGMVTRVAGIASGKLGLAKRIWRHFLQVVDNIVTVAHRINAVFHAILFVGVYVVNVIYL